MIYVGIDVTKDKQDYLITNSDGQILFFVFTISNDPFGFYLLLQRIKSCSNNLTTIKKGLEATGHYSNIIVDFLINKNYHIYNINPLLTSLYKKSLSFRKIKTDKADVQSIVSTLMPQKLTPYVPASYDKKELKSLTRYRFNLVKGCLRLYRLPD